MDRYGGRASRCPQNLPDFCRVRLDPGEQRGCFPAFGGLGAAFGVQNRKAPACWPRAFRFAKRYPGGCGSAFGGAFPAGRFEHRRAAAAGRGKSNQVCCPFSATPGRGRTAESFSGTVPAPNAEAAATTQSFLLGPHIFVQTCPPGRIWTPSAFLLDRARPVFFRQDRKKMGGASPRPLIRGPFSNDLEEIP